MTSSLHVVGSKQLGGAEGFYLRLIQALKERNEKVTCLLRRGSDLVKAVGTDLTVIESPMRTVWDPWSKHKVTQAIQSLTPDIVQTYMGRATRLTRLPLGQRPVHVARLGGYYKLDGYRHAHAWIGNTERLCDYLIHNGMPTERVFHIYNFIDFPQHVMLADAQAQRLALGIPDDALVLMTAGRFIPVKGHTYLLEALARLPVTMRGRPLWLLMVGDGPLRKKLQSQARRLGLEKRTLWVGWQRSPSIYFHTADLVVFPSLEEETFGNVILEAWAHQKPLVTAGFRGARELVRHQRDAWQVPCADVVSLARGIRTVLTETQLAAELAGEGHRRAQRYFSREVITARYIELYAQLLRKI